MTVAAESSVAAPVDHVANRGPLPALTPAYIITGSAPGAVEVIFDGRPVAGVLDVPGGVVRVGDTLALTLLGGVDLPIPAAEVAGRDFTVLVTSMNGTIGAGWSPGVRFEVEIEGDLPAALAASCSAPVPAAGGGNDDDVDCEDDDSIRGSLRRLPLAELVQALSLSRNSATIRLRVPGGRGTVHLVGGEVTNARHDDPRAAATARGVSAFSRLLACSRGTFRVSFDEDAPAEPDVHGSTLMLILDALRQLDEERRGPATDGEPLLEVDDSDLLCELSDEPEPLARPSTPSAPVDVALPDTPGASSPPDGDHARTLEPPRPAARRGPKAPARPKGGAGRARRRECRLT